MSKIEKTKEGDNEITESDNAGISNDNDNALIKIESPATQKFIRTIVSGLGVVAGQALLARQIRQTGKAKAKAIRELAQAEKEAIEMLGPERGREIAMTVQTESAISERAETRISFQEQKRQNNIEEVTWQAAHKIPKEVSKEPVHPDWIARFFENAKDISDKTMQSIWSSILAGEVETPGKTSLRTLDVLKNLTQQDAQEFERVLQFSFSGSFVYYPQTKTAIDQTLSYNRKINMEACGLIHHEGGNINLNLNNEKCYIFIGEFLFKVYPIPLKKTFSIGIPGFAILPAGVEIAQFIPAKFPEPKYILEFAKFLFDNKFSLCLEDMIPLRNIGEEPDPKFVSSDAKISISPRMPQNKLRTVLQNFQQRNRKG